MILPVFSVIPRRPGALKPSGDIRLSPQILESSSSGSETILQKLKTSRDGLTSREAAARLKEYGPNVVGQDKRHTRLKLLGKALINPLVIFLSVLAAVSAATGDLRAAVVMAAMVLLGVVLRFLQESRADAAAAKLKAMISVNATVVRNGATREIPLSQIVPGDLVHLAADAGE